VSSIWRVYQTKFGYPEGDCVRASYASLLRKPLEEIPRFDPATLRSKISFITFGSLNQEHRQKDAERRWLNELGYDLVIIPAEDKPKIHPSHYHLMSTTAMSPQGPIGHRVVGRGGKLAFDPHPPNGLPIMKVNSFLFVVPLRK